MPLDRFRCDKSYGMCFIYKLVWPPKLQSCQSTFRYNSYVQFHSGVVLFFVNFSVRVRVSYRFRVWDRVQVRDR